MKLLRQSAYYALVILTLYILSFGPASVFMGPTPNTFLYRFYSPIFFASNIPIIGLPLLYWATLWEWLIGS